MFGGWEALKALPMQGLVLNMSIDNSADWRQNSENPKPCNIGEYCMFRTCVHKDVAASLETIGAAFAIFESKQRKPGNMTLVSANSRFEEITKRPIIDCIGLSPADLFLRYIEKQMRGCFIPCLAMQESQETEVLIEYEGRSQWWRFLVSPILADDCGNQRMIVTMIDITDKKVLEHELEVARQRYAALVETSYDGIITIDHNQMITMTRR
jgi:PAS domain-containing protein